MTSTETAARIALRFGDYRKLVDEHGVTIADACAAAGGVPLTCRHGEVLYRFPDGSGIVVAPERWDLAAGPACACRRSDGHDVWCEDDALWTAVPFRRQFYDTLAECGVNGTRHTARHVMSCLPMYTDVAALILVGKFNSERDLTLEREVTLLLDRGELVRAVRVAARNEAP